MTAGGALGRFLRWARVVDAHDGTVSLTSLLLGGVGAAVVAAPSWPGVVALIIAAGLYGHKRITNRTTVAERAAIDARLETLAKAAADAAEKLKALQDLPDSVTRLKNTVEFHAKGRR